MTYRGSKSRIGDEKRDKQNKTKRENLSQNENRNKTLVIRVEVNGSGRDQGTKTDKRLIFEFE